MEIMFVIFHIYPLAADRATRNHRDVARDASVNLLVVVQRSSKTMTENHIVRLVFGTNTYDPVLTVTGDSFAALEDKQGYPLKVFYSPSLPRGRPSRFAHTTRAPAPLIPARGGGSGLRS